MAASDEYFESGMLQENDPENVTSYKIVQEQLRDVIQLKDKENGRLTDIVSFQVDKSICKEEYDCILKQLEKERFDHARTRAQLMDCTDKLAFAEGEIEILKKQIVREKQQYEQAFGQLRSQALKESSKKVALQHKVSEIERKVESKEDTLHTRQQQVRELNAKLMNQKENYEKKICQITVAKQQDIYIAKMLEQDDAKRQKRRKCTLKPNT